MNEIQTVVRRPTEQELRENPTLTSDTAIVIRHPRAFELTEHPSWSPTMFVKVAYIPKRDVITGRQSAQARVLALVAAKRKDDPKLSESEAQHAVFSENVTLHAQYVAEVRISVGPR